MTPTKPSHHGHDDHLYSDADFHNEDVAHEHSDVNVRALLIFCIGLAAVAAIVHIAMYGLFIVFERQAAANDPVVSPLTRPAGALPPEPRLLTDEPGNLRQFHASQAEALKGIEDAKKQLLQQGLPVRPNAPADPWLGQHSQAWGGSSSGRAIPLVPGASGAAPPAAEQPAPPPPPQHATPTPKSGGH
jgi:hypothetical protein